MSVSVAVLGGGNGGHAAAADLSNRGFEVHLYEDARFAPKMQQVFDTHRITMAGAAGNAEVTVAMVTSDLAQAIEGVKYIFVAVPGICPCGICREAGRACASGPDHHGASRYL